MELRQLRYFVAVAEELHYGRAAERLHISGPALSQQIIALERELSAELFVRDRRSVALTEAGRSLLDDARRMLALAEDARQRLHRTAAETTPLRIGYVSWLPDDIAALLGRRHRCESMSGCCPRMPRPTASPKAASISQWHGWTSVRPKHAGSQFISSERSLCTPSGSVQRHTCLRRASPC
ncbi:LysR family transcriptional regulator [Mycobacterium sp. ACS1612]|uniref:LysR family transcriptional regulator n=1 Tax=Mycobacterium sp. ACS1612 TaxID=1834117 RepID=UPI000A8A714F|nr:LysR family transcriptional regulator [Mycobacterium sp. ACS1612]